ncbi:MAG: 2-hydroxychromene-2-carboxylate isomerase [Burkholderiales bacterium]|nr:2-hydroxychromene-2-carboxylate isomerase [Burkholderiales bacterium]
MKLPIDFHFDFSSPYSYIASEWIEALAARHGRTVRWHAILLGATFQAADLRSPVSYPIKREYSLRDFKRSARFEGVPFVQPDRFPVNSLLAARVFWWLADTQGAEAAVAWARAGLRGYFTRGLMIDEPAGLRELAAACALDPQAVEAACADPAVKARLKAENDQAIAAGVFGAPFFFVDGEPFWGNDRKVQIERWLAQGPF